MNSNDVQEYIYNLETTIKDDWSDSQRASCMNLCLQIIKYITSHRVEEVQHLTKQSILNLSNTPLSNEDLIDVLRYLSGDRVEILTTKFEFIDDETDEPYILGYEDVSYLQDSGVLAHPLTGEKVEDADQKVFMFFSPSEKLKSMISEK